METSKEYVVPNLSEYVFSADQIPEVIVRDLINEFIEKTEEDNIASAKEMLGIGVTWIYSKPMFHSAYFMKRTSYHSWAKNELAIVVSYIKNQGSSDEETVYTVLEFWNIAVNSDGTMNIVFEDGSNSISTTNWEATLNDYKDDYEVYKINIK